MSADAPPAAKRGRTEPADAAVDPAGVRALEFYCGVGGLHYSLLRARPDGDARVVGAFDINPNACDVYEHNFGTRPIANSLFAVPASKLDAFNSSLWLMSPPCQPFTRQGSQKDKKDARAESFLRLLDVMPSLKKKPSHLLVENVVGFETSETREALLETLTQNGFTFREFILSPRMFGVPYSRPRYFCVAKTKGLKWADGKEESLEKATVPESATVPIPGPHTVRRSPPPSWLSHPKHWVPCGYEDDLAPADPAEATVPRPRREEGQTAAQAAAAAKKSHERLSVLDPDRKTLSMTPSTTYGVAPLRGFLEPGSEEVDSPVWSTHAVPNAELVKAKLSVDAVLPNDRKCNCFTKSYGKFTKGTGSFVVERRFDFKKWDPRDLQERDMEETAKNARDKSSEVRGDVKKTENEKSRPPRARYFSPREVANIHSFPHSFAFPERITKTQRFALLGNSLSVACVAPLLEYLLNDTEEA